MSDMRQVAVIYVRVSTDEQVSGTSLTTQERDCRAWCDRNEIEIDRVFCDAGASAKTADRQQFKSMIEYCRAHSKTVTHVVIWKTDRFSRSSTDYAIFRGLLSSWGVQLASATENFSDDPAGKLLETILSGIAQFDNDVRAQRTKTAMSKLLQDGYWTFRAPVGYKNARVNGRPTLVEDELVAPLVRKAFQNVADGLWSKRDVQVFLNESGVKISSSRVSVMLNDPVYCGMIVNDMAGDKPIDGQFQAIVPEHIYRKAQEQLKGRSRPSMYSTTPEVFPWKGVLICRCGKHLTGSRSRGKCGKHYFYYQCKCGASRLRVECAESQVYGLLDQITTAYADVYVLLCDAVADCLREQQAEHLAMVGAIQADINKNKARMQRLVDSYADGVVSRDNYIEASRRQEAEKAFLLSKLDEARGDVEDADATMRKAQGIVADLSNTVSRLPALAQRDFLNAVFQDGILISGRKVQTPISASVFGRFAAILSGKNKMASQITELSNLINAVGLCVRLAA